jgi:hypothetical protein
MSVVSRLRASGQNDGFCHFDSDGFCRLGPQLSFRRVNFSPSKKFFKMIFSPE